MTRLTRFALVGSAVLGVTLLAGFARGGAPCHGDPARFERFATVMVEDTLDELEATDAQRATVLGVKDQLLTEGMAIHEGKTDLKATFEAEWASEQPDAQKLHAAVDERLAELTTFAHHAVDALLTVHATLSPEQRVELKEIHDERAERRSW